MTTSHPGDELSTTPRPSQTSFPQTLSYDPEDQSHLKTPTRDSFQTAASLSRHPADVISPGMGGAKEPQMSQGKSAPVRTASLRTAQSGVSGDGNAAGNDGAGTQEDGSDNEDATSETSRPTKKKKGQRFYCTDFPPCNLSFTRSEHLARHIRKHTGERPFQCHCLRRFSRLDNLRQHAQTVHLNEDIPPESLAATGTRFQRQVRTDRVRAPGGRSRASTLNSQSSYTKGHSRGISSSSIGSLPDFGAPDDPRQQQQPQQQMFQQHPQHQHMHQHPTQQHHHQQHQQMSMGPPTPSRNGLTLDTFAAATAGPDHPYYPYYNQNSTGYSTPPSVFSADPNSPVAHPGLQSPIAMVPRGMIWAQPMHARRVSVSSGSVPFGSPSSYGSNVSYMSPFTPSNTSTFSNGSMITSPSSSTFSDVVHFDANTEGDMRRRTWHPGTYGGYEQRPATSGLSYHHQTPDSPKPSAPAAATANTQSAAAQNVRLPGIDSFDRANQKSAAPAALRPTSPMEVDTPTRPRSLTDASVLSSTGADAALRPERVMAAPRRRAHVYTHSAPKSLESAAREFRAPTSDAPVTPRRQKRQGWYNGPIQGSQPMEPARTNSGGSNSSAGGPQTPAMNSEEYQPAIIHSNGYIEPLPPGVMIDPQVKGYHQVQVPMRRPLHQPMSMASHVSHPDQFANRRSGDTDRLDALVAVATSENQVVQRG